MAAVVENVIPDNVVVMAVGIGRGQIRISFPSQTERQRDGDSRQRRMHRIEQICSLREKFHACGHMARFIEGLSGLRIAEHNPKHANENHYGGNGHKDRRT